MNIDGLDTSLVIVTREKKVNLHILVRGHSLLEDIASYLDETILLQLSGYDAYDFNIPKRCIGIHG
ncbi:MAG: hypothetical protein DI613_11100 [Kocuria rhizophila]|nr:MAG: hypothetical protein DI613_11100 [Kocuria rhizophila]